MGIRFACPNGHPLHVKVDLAGKRGICPECQAKFLIPQPTASQAARTASKAASVAASAPRPAASPSTPTAPAAAAPSQAPATAPAPAAPPTTASSGPPSDTSPNAPPADPTPAGHPADQPTAWYIRPASGGQFGPADDALIQQWAAEGRIGADSYVWRTGWPDWRLASDLPEHFPQLQTIAAAPQLPASEYNASSGMPVKSTQSTDDPALATARYRRRKQQAARGQQLIAVLLVVLTIALAGVLAWVIYSMNNPAPEVSPEPSAPAPAAVDPPPEVATDAMTEQETDGADSEAMDATPAE